MSIRILSFTIVLFSRLDTFYGAWHHRAPPPKKTHLWYLFSFLGEGIYIYCTDHSLLRCLYWCTSLYWTNWSEHNTVPYWTVMETHCVAALSPLYPLLDRWISVMCSSSLHMQRLNVEMNICYNGDILLFLSGITTLTIYFETS